jgi:hypothetical protein
MIMARSLDFDIPVFAVPKPLRFGQDSLPNCFRYSFSTAGRIYPKEAASRRDVGFHLGALALPNLSPFKIVPVL